MLTYNVYEKKKTLKNLLEAKKSVECYAFTQSTTPHAEFKWFQTGHVERVIIIFLSGKCTACCCKSWTEAKNRRLSY